MDRTGGEGLELSQRIVEMEDGISHLELSAGRIPKGQILGAFELWERTENMRREIRGFPHDIKLLTVSLEERIDSVAAQLRRFF
jgi:hypothetical protein